MRKVDQIPEPLSANRPRAPALFICRAIPAERDLKSITSSSGLFMLCMLPGTGLFMLHMGVSYLSINICLEFLKGD